MLGVRYMNRKTSSSQLPYYIDQYWLDREKYKNSPLYQEYSFQACPLDTGNPKWYYRDTRKTFKGRDNKW